MDFRESLSAELPAPRDDEPDGLRDDIVDELADHLACAYRGELLRGADPATARERALKRFGDPAAVARRLWLDAMKGKIMAQRALVISCVLLTLICLALAGMIWTQEVRSQRMAAEAQAVMARRMAEAQAVQQQMLKQLQAMSKAVEKPQAPDWIPVSFKLVQETPEGPPAANVQASLGHGSGGSNKSEAIRRQADANGIVDFGVVQPGDWEYRFELHFPSQPTRPIWSAVGNLNVLPGTKIEKVIVCPKTPSVQVAVKPRVEWPADLADKNLLVEADFAHEGWTYQAPLHWSVGGFLWNVLCGPAKEQVRRLDGGPLLWRLAPAEVERARLELIYADALQLSPDQPEADSIALEPGTYQLRSLVILKPTSLQVKCKGGVRFEVVGFTSQETIHLYSQPPVYPTNPWAQIMNFTQGQATETRVPMSRESLKRMAGSFVAERGRISQWTIRLPEELVETVRDKLKVEPPAKKK
jgi:hypothetical protein